MGHGGSKGMQCMGHGNAMYAVCMYVCGMHVCMHVGSFVNVHVKGWNGMERDGMK